MILQLYLHFPFCKRKCLYCDFVSAAAGDETIAAYCAALEKEIVSAAQAYPDALVSTVFLGGGTPSIVPPAQMKRVLATLKRSFRFAGDVEFTSEANPGTLTGAWLETLMEAGMNRLSLGVQAAQEELLRRVGRIHTFSQAEESVRMAQGMGLVNINADVMYGLPGQQEADYLETLQRVCAMGVTHVSAYSLIVEEGTPLCAMVESGSLSVPDDDRCAAMTESGIQLLKENGFSQYEISNYAREGYACRHNIGYWQGAWYRGLGVAAHSFLPPDDGQGIAGVRVANTESLQQYLQAPCAGGEKTWVTADEAMFETMMLGLRMNAGVSVKQFARKHGRSMTERYGFALDGLVRDGLACWRDTVDGDRVFALTARGLLLQNEALLRLMD